MHLDDNFSEAHPRQASLMFGDAALIMVPHYPSSHQESDEKIEQAYHSYLLQHFSFVASSQSWSLYRRKAIVASFAPWNLEHFRKWCRPKIQWYPIHFCKKRRKWMGHKSL